MHESLSLATMVALAVHALSLLGDSYINLSLADVTIPFVSGYERFWMGVGIVAGWAFVILGLSYYVRARIGIQRWRVLHRFTALAWVLGIGHALMMGTDAGTALVPARGRPGRRPRRRAARAPPHPDPGSRMRFDCFGSRCGVWAATPAAEEDARRCLENWHRRFSRFVASSELSRLNADPRDVVAVSTTMTRLIETVREAAEATGGLVDGTLLGEIEAAGYTGDLGAPLPLDAGAAARPAAPPRRAEPALALAGDRPATAGRSTAPTASASTAAGWPRACSPTSSPSACRRTSRSTAAATCASAARRAGWRSPTRSAARPSGRLRVGDRSRGDQRDRPAQLARPGRAARAPPARPSDRAARVHRRRPGHRARPDRGRGRMARQGRRPLRPRAGRGLARPRRCRRPRRRQPPSRSTDGKRGIPDMAASCEGARPGDDEGRKRSKPPSEPANH